MYFLNINDKNKLVIVGRAVFALAGPGKGASLVARIPISNNLAGTHK
jgi:hypothetical protein